MHTILVLNPKGGSGKSTLSTNLAGFFACWGVRVTIADFDEQATALDWLAARPASCPAIEGIDSHDAVLPRHRPTDYLILDVPSGHYGEDLLPWLKQADKIIVPVVPSPHDIRAAKRFLDWIATEERMQECSPSIGIVANRVRENTRSFKLLKSFLESVHIPCMAILRDTQNYILAAQHGLSIFELPSYKVKQDLQQWQRLIKWLCIDPHIYPDVPIKPQQSVFDSIYKGITL
jgi:chromosome partitioning protein